jgi:hypothetical protein
MAAKQCIEIANQDTSLTNLAIEYKNHKIENCLIYSLLKYLIKQPFRLKTCLNYDK